MEQGPDREPVTEGRTHRWSLLLEAVIGLARTGQVDDLLARLVHLGASLVRARYVVLSVVGPDSVEPSRLFMEHGTAPPPGEDLLVPGAWMEVPVRVGDQVFGHLRLVASTTFDEEDEEIVVALAAAAGVTIENARLHSEARRRERWLAATAEITARLLEQTTEIDALQLVADRARELAGATVSWVISGADEDGLELRVVSGADIDIEYMRTLPLDQSMARSVLSSGEPLRLDDLSRDQRVSRHGLIPGWPRLGPGIVVPLQADGARGALGLGWEPVDRDRFDRLESALPAGFAQQASLALKVSQAQADQRQLAVLRDRDRIGRDLHDVVIQRLFAVGLGLESIGRLPPEQHAQRLDDAVEQIDETIRDLRTAIHQLRRAGQTRDVHEQVCDVVAWSEPVLGFRPYLRFTGPVRTGIPDAVVPDLLAVLTEAISNAGRHAQATTLRVEVTVRDDAVVLVVRDDGRGIGDPERDSGLGNMRHRALRHGGRLTLGGGVGQGTEVRWEVPLAPPRALA
ncbi:Oxygen sensor histidine kinase response regulator DevS/DosS [Nocardioides aquaticus]|uniref:Oxygen sensor histidine kinase response regulator DevS/DosS n=1 Tax=Nocardioides aquaticus TaxID=160826 RepID=A0ABX8EI97_9ACTN|nr:GAF domain-containing protein [Nocardioides aquaticus]QVT80211.1 Oxygen sensor histidine kinase response regulator DevS/DosS [Nocardioides aquaticus]